MNGNGSLSQGSLARDERLHADADWRWMDGREDSPWYPTMRRFRQQAAGEWAAVIARVAARLREMAERREMETRG